MLLKLSFVMAYLLAISSVMAQDKAVVVTDVNYFLQAMAVVDVDPTANLLNESVFPDYLTETAFSNSVLQNLHSDLDSLMNGYSIESMPAKVLYEHTYFRSKAKAKAMSKENKDDKIYLSLEFKISLQAHTGENPNYALNVKIKG